MSGPRKVALLIGNSDYRNAAKLANPESDARELSLVLKRIGFSVDVRYNVDRVEMESAIRSFILAARTADIAMFYYSGHGLEVSGENYLLPVDVRMSDETALKFETISPTVITEALAGDKRVGIVLLDACRDNPFAEALRRSLSASRSVIWTSSICTPANWSSA